MPVRFSFYFCGKSLVHVNEVNNISKSYERQKHWTTFHFCKKGRIVGFLAKATGKSTL
jgi:hypothetical protein